MGVLEWKLDATQKKIYDFFKNNESKTTIITASRRLGKSYILTVIAVEKCLQEPKSIVKFIQPEQKMVRMNIKPLMEEVFKDAPPTMRPVFKTQDNIYVFANGSEIQLAGTDNGNHDKLRGGNAHLCLVDEAAFCSDLKYIINSILIPSTTLTKGKIVLSSTPPRTQNHEFVKYMEMGEQQGNGIKKTIWDAVEDSKDEPSPRITKEIVEDIVKNMPNGAMSDEFRTEYMCVDADTLIKTKEGYKPIESININDLVFTHKGNYKSVTNIFKNKLGSKEMYKIYSSNNEGFRVTGDHLVYIVKKSHYGKIKFEGWQRVDSIQLDTWDRVYFKVPLETKPESSTLSNDLFYLSGWFVAEGHLATKTQQVWFSLSRKDPAELLSDICQKEFGNNLKLYNIRNKNKSCLQYALNSKKAKSFFSAFGNGAKNKKIPDFIKQGNKQQKLEFIRGLLGGDGYTRKTNTGTFRVLATSSRTLAHDFSELLLDLQIENTICFSDRPKTTVIEGRTVNQSGLYTVNFNAKHLLQTPNKIIKRSYIKDNFLYSKIRKIEKIEYKPEFVYDIEVKDDHSYVSSHGVFHNCEVIRDGDLTVVPEFTDEAAKDIILEWPRPPFFDSYVSMDIGFKDLTVVLFGYYDFENAVSVIEDEIVIQGPKMTTEFLAEEIARRENRLWTSTITGEFNKPYLRVSDNNLIVINDLHRLHGLLFLPTKKDNKDAQINDLRMLVSSAQIKINPRCKTLIQHLKSATWNNKRTEFSRSADNGHYDAVDALLYFIRNVDRNKNPYPKGYFRYGHIPRSDLFLSERGETDDKYSKFQKMFTRKGSLYKKEED